MGSGLSFTSLDSVIQMRLPWLVSKDRQGLAYLGRFVALQVMNDSVQDRVVGCPENVCQVQIGQAISGRSVRGERPPESVSAFHAHMLGPFPVVLRYPNHSYVGNPHVPKQEASPAPGYAPRLRCAWPPTCLRGCTAHCLKQKPYHGVGGCCAPGRTRPSHWIRR